MAKNHQNIDGNITKIMSFETLKFLLDLQNCKSIFVNWTSSSSVDSSSSKFKKLLILLMATRPWTKLAKNIGMLQDKIQ